MSNKIFHIHSKRTGKVTRVLGPVSTTSHGDLSPPPVVIPPAPRTGSVNKALTAAHLSALGTGPAPSTSPEQKIGINDGFWEYYAQQVPGRDVFEYLPSHPAENFHLLDVAANASHYLGFLPYGGTFPDYAHWNETYNPAQAYPSSASPGDDNYLVCVYQGVDWMRTNHTPQTGTPPNPADGAGHSSGWMRYGFADPSTVNINAAGWPTKHPDDTHLQIMFYLPWNCFPESRYPCLVHCKTEPGVNLILNGGGTNVVMSNQNLGAGTFDLTFNADNRAYFLIDRATPISSAFFVAGVPTFETGTVSQDIGSPYVQKDKLSDMAPFYAVRNMSAARVNRNWTGVPNGKTAANSVPVGGCRFWKYNVDMANTAGHPAIWVNVDDTADDTYVDAMAAYYLANLNSDIIVYLERGNEMWNEGFGQSRELRDRALALGITKPQLHARECSHMISRWKSVWGGSANRLRGVLAWQAVAILSGDYQTMLDFENTYLNIDCVSVAMYYENTNITGTPNYSPFNFDLAPDSLKAAVVANDFATFSSGVDVLMRQSVDWDINLLKDYVTMIHDYQVARGRDPNLLKMVAYEGGPQSLVEGNWDSLGAGMRSRVFDWSHAYRRGSLAASTYAYFINRMATEAPIVYMAFDYQAPGDGWGHMDREGHPEQEPYVTLKNKALLYN